MTVRVSKNKVSHLLVLVVCGLLLLCVLAAGLFLLVSSLREDVSTTFDMSGTNSISFDVHYLQNEMWDDNPIPRDLFFLMSFTDHIEVKNSLQVSLSESSRIYYTCRARVTLDINYAGNVGGLVNPPLLREQHTLYETSGHVDSHYVHITGIGADSHDYFRIDPRPYIETYFMFANAQRRQMEREGLMVLGFRGLSAELLIEFDHTVSVPQMEVFRQTTRGYRIPLTNEVYTLHTTGGPESFGESISVLTMPGGIEPRGSVILLLVLAGVLSSAGVAYSLSKLLSDPNEKRRMAKKLLRKYAAEIVTSDTMYDLTGYKVMPVVDFLELLKLSVNLNRHIMCHHDKNAAHFAVTVDNWAYTLDIEYSERIPVNVDLL